MTAHPAARMGSFLVLTLGLLLTAEVAAPPPIWVGEIEGASMAPTLWGERIAFPCHSCGRTLLFDRALGASRSLFCCDHCETWQVAPPAETPIPADRVVIARFGAEIPRKVLAAIEHPQFGLSIKRIIAIPGDVVAARGDKVWVNGQVAPQFEFSPHSPPTDAVIGGLTGDVERLGPEQVWRLRPGEHFALGDCRAISVDSRDARFGLVQRGQIRGIVVEIRPALAPEACGGPLAGAKRSRSAAK